MGNSSYTPTIKRKYLNKSNVINYANDKIIQNSIIIWLDCNIKSMQKDTIYTISELHKICSSITLYTDSEECRKFIEKPRDEQIFLIVSGKLGEKLVPLVHKYVRLDSIYVFCGYPEAHYWTKEWKKIKIVSKNIEPICQMLVIDAAECEQDLTPTSVLSVSNSENQDLKQFNTSFMYSQLISEILMEINYDREALCELTKFCREQYSENETQLKIIDEFEVEYEKHTPIWWYTRECFVYKVLNHSLRTVDIEVIAMLGFFIKDIHEQIKSIHSKMSKRLGSFLVHRGQGMLINEFQELRNNIGGYIAFNNFLSTSESIDTAMRFTNKTLNRSGKVSLLFEIEVDPADISTPYAILDGTITCHLQEKEILFSMHSIFRIIQIQAIDNQIWKVKLKSISSNDTKIRGLTEQMKRQLGEGCPMDRLGRLMIILNELEKADAFYRMLSVLIYDNDEETLAWINNQFGYIRYKQNKYFEAQSLYEAAMKIQEKRNPKKNLHLAVTYTNMGLLYTDLEDASNALLYHQKALDIRENNSNVRLSDLAATYSNIGLVYDTRKDYLFALKHYGKALTLYKQTDPGNHLWIATTHKNIGLAQFSLGKYEEALESLFEAEKIRKLELPPNHPSIASVCNSIGDVYLKQADYVSALKYYEEALDIEKQAPNVNCSKLALTYHMISKTLINLEQHDRAVEYAKLSVQEVNKSPISSKKDVEKFTQYLAELQTNL